MGTERRIRVSVVAVPVGLAIVIALAALSYASTRADISPGQTFAVPGTVSAGNALVVDWRTGTDIAIIVSFTPSRSTRIRSITLTGLDPKNAFVVSAQYGFWDGSTPLPSFTSEADLLPSDLYPHAVTGAFSAPAHSRVIVRMLLRAISDAKVTEVLTGVRVDAVSWAWAHTTFIPFRLSVKLQRPR
jgi:hypothetical protein